MRISLFIPCYVDQFFPEIAVAMVDVLERLGHEVHYPGGQTCCGQPTYNSGFEEEAGQVAVHWVQCFRDADLIAAPSASCVTMVRTIVPGILQDRPDAAEISAVTAKTFEFSELLVDHLGVEDVAASFPHRVTFHDGCHGLRELGLHRQPRSLLARVRGLELIEHDEAESCCGFGGAFSVAFPQISTAMAETKARSIARAGVRYVISCDPTCLMQLRGYFEKQHVDIGCLHLAEVLRQTA